MAQTLLVYDDVCRFFAHAHNAIIIGAQSGYELDLTGQTCVIFTVKESLADDDSDALMQIRSDTGLTYIGKDPVAQVEGVEATDGSLTVGDTTVGVTLRAIASAELEQYEGPAHRWDIKKLTADGPVMVATGRAVISLPATKAIS